MRISIHEGFRGTGAVPSGGFHHTGGSRPRAAGQGLRYLERHYRPGLHEHEGNVQLAEVLGTQDGAVRDGQRSDRRTLPGLSLSVW